MRRLTLPVLVLAVGLAACSGGDPAPVEDAADTTAEASDDAAEADGGADAEDAGETAAEEPAEGGSVTFTGTDSVAWEETEVSTAAGPVEVSLACGPSVPHGLGIEGVQGGEELAACDEAATVELEAGTYTFFCTVSGHREAGMEGTLTVG